MTIRSPPPANLLPPNETSLRIYCTKLFLFQINLSCHDISLVQITSPGIGTAVRQACMVHKKTKWRVWCIRKQNGAQKNQTLMRPKMRPSRIILRLVLWLLILRVQSRVSDYHSNQDRAPDRAVTNLVAMASEIYFATKFRRKSSIGDHQIKEKEKKEKNPKKFIDLSLNYETNKRLYLPSLSFSLSPPHNFQCANTLNGRWSSRNDFVEINLTKFFWWGDHFPIGALDTA